MTKDIPVLILAYKRALNLESIVETCRAAGVLKIYFAVDAPSTVSDSLSVQMVKAVISKFQTESDLEIKTRFLHENAGCAAAVITACDWFFEQEDLGIVLEDDCIPSLSFFDFMRDAIPLINGNSEIWLASGTQFFTEELKNTGWVLSRYPMHWGWGTTAHAWLESRTKLDLDPPTIKKFLKSISNPELMYWFAGERRAFYGFTDVWDSIYASNMFRANKFALVPSTNLITNTGNDLFATNTIGDKKYTGRGLGEYLRTDAFPKHSKSYDLVIKKEFFEIGMRHYLTTMYTMFLDYFFPKRKRFPHLDSRIMDISVD